MADFSAGVKVVGLDEVVAGFRRISRDTPKALRVAFIGIAKFVVGRAKGRMEFGSGEAMSGVKAGASAKGASIQYPGGGLPWRGVKAAYYPWLDFGGTTGRGHNSGTVKNRTGGSALGSGTVRRPFVKGGRYIYPAIAESRDEIHEAAAEAIEQVARATGFQTGKT